MVSGLCQGYLADSENLRKFQKFLVTVDNYCTSTSGADYAVDDIRFYQKRAIVDVIQNQPVCDDVASAASVKLKFVRYMKACNLAPL